MRTNPLPVPRRALAIGAHPDDIEFGAGGTLARWASEGCEIVMAIMTDGSKGSWDPDEVPSVLVERRAAEQREAAGILGAVAVEMLGHVDGELVNTLEVRRQVAALIRRHRPDVVLSHDPWAPYEIHPDHRATGWAAVDGAVAARDHLFYPDDPQAHHRPDLLLLWRAGKPDHWEDITPTFEVKLAALLAHESQHLTTMADAGAGDSERETFTAQVRARAAEQGEAGGLALAEAFKQLAL